MAHAPHFPRPARPDLRRVPPTRSQPSPPDLCPVCSRHLSTQKRPARFRSRWRRTTLSSPLPHPDTPCTTPPCHVGQCWTLIMMSCSSSWRRTLLSTALSSHWRAGLRSIKLTPIPFPHFPSLPSRVPSSCTAREDRERETPSSLGAPSYRLPSLLLTRLCPLA